MSITSRQRAELNRRRQLALGQFIAEQTWREMERVRRVAVMRALYRAARRSV